MAKAKCHKGIVRFKTKRGKVISFKGNKGAGCGPRKKPSTRHLAPYKKIFALAVKHCKVKLKRGGKKAFNHCVGQEVKTVVRAR